jgi:redox-sensitive bicupin YhaK (pirin superfamily)
MIELRRAAQRGFADHGWLSSYHTFSFAGYQDPAHMGFGPLRVINEDRIAGGGGFATHSHSDMEILSYVLDGELAHRDSLGNGAVIRPGDVQRMSAGTGVSHSEFNQLADRVTHFLQIWILPDQLGLPPSYEQKHYPDAERRGKLRLLASRDGRDGSVRVHQDTAVYGGLIDGAERAVLALGAGRLGYVHLARGAARVNGEALLAGDAAKLRDESAIEVSAGQQAELLCFDLPR